MLKKLIITFLILVVSTFSFARFSFANCELTDYWVSDSLNTCLSETTLLNSYNTKVWINWWFWERIKNWVDNIATVLWLLAVWAIVYWALLMTISAWEEEKTKKAKDIVKWSIIWFIWLISVSALIKLTVNVIYSIW
jgi:hypothetical protein